MCDRLIYSKGRVFAILSSYSSSYSTSSFPFTCVSPMSRLSSICLSRPIVSSSYSPSYSFCSFPFTCVSPMSRLSYICLSRPYLTDLPACVLVVSRFMTTDFRTTVNTCMLQSRGGARTSKPLFHRFLLERKEWNVSSLATPRPYCLIDRSATWSVCRPVVVDYTVSFASSLFV